MHQLMLTCHKRYSFCGIGFFINATPFLDVHKLKRILCNYILIKSHVTWHIANYNNNALWQFAYVHIQVDNLQAELAYVQARLSILKHGSCPLPMDLQPRSSNSVSGSSLTSLHFGQTPVESSCLSSNDNTSLDEELFEEDDLEILARELVAKYLPVPKI